MKESMNIVTLLLWKNWTLQKRKRKSLFLNVSLPFFIGAFLLYIRYSAKIHEKDVPVTFQPFEPTFIPGFPSDVLRNLEEKSDIFLNGKDYENNSSYDHLTKNYTMNISKEFLMDMRWTIVSSPDHILVNQIMERACKSIKVRHFPVKNSEALEEIMTIPSEYFLRPRDMILAGVVFPDIIDEEKFLVDLNIKIRFPAETRFPIKSPNAMLPKNWLTGLVFPLFQLPGPREPGSSQGGSPGYFGEGFLGVQNAISMSILNSLQKKEDADNSVINIELRRFPYSKHVIDPLLLIMQNILPFLIVVSFIFSVNTITEKITTEKERRLKVIMNIMGLSDSLRWISWFIYSFIFFFVLVFILILTFKVPFVHGRAVFPNSDWSCLALFFICYIFAAITFCFLISTIFSKATVASIVAGMAWFLLFVPFYIIQNKYGEISTTIKLLASLLLNTGLGIGLHITLIMEGIGTGIQWDNLTTSPISSDDMTMASSMGILFFDSILHLCLALYIENVFPGKYGSPLPWYYPFQRSYWFNGTKRNVSDVNVTSSEDYPLEDGPKNATAGVEIKNLVKVYSKGNKLAVKNLSLNAYEGQITVLMGFNGAGKTTVMSILTGIIPPTSGTAIVAGANVENNIKEVRKNLGFCPQYNVLFDELTVTEHVYFFGKLKYLNNEEIKNETENYIKLLNLSDKRHTLAKHLSGGMKRKLSVALAMCGGTKVLFLDEPTANMDPSARRSLWDLLLSAKEGRSILITTHHLDEADLLGDRVAIMSEGKLYCCGSTFFLKQKFPCGYHLVMVKKDNCDTRKVTELIQRYIPEEVIAEDIGMELSYRLPEKYSYKFQELFHAIETEMEELKITSFGVSPTSLEDVFMRIAQNIGRVNEMSEHTEEPQNKEKMESIIEIKGYDSENRLTGFDLRFNQIIAMLFKHAKVTIRSWKTHVLLVFITICGLGNAIFTMEINNQMLKLPPRVLDFGDFPGGIVSIEAEENCENLCNDLMEKYSNFVISKKMKVNSTASVSMEKYLLQECDTDVQKYRMNHILGTTFRQKDQNIFITGWFNNQPYHTPPLALSAIYNTLFKVMKSDSSVTFTNEPLPYREETQVDIQGSGLGAGFQISTFIAFTYVFVTSGYITFPVNEREVKAKLLQFVSGINCYIFWFIAFFWNFILTIGPNTALIVLLALFPQEGFGGPNEIGSCAIIIFSYFASILPLIYLSSLIFSKTSLAFIVFSFFNIITGIFLVILVVILQIPLLDLTEEADVLDWIFSLFPLYSMTRSLQSVNTVSTRFKMCEPIYENFCIKNKNYINICCKVPEQCPDGVCLEWTNSYLDWNPPGFGKYIVFLLITGTIFFTILLLHENRVLHFLRFRYGGNAKSCKIDGKDSDVIQEQEKICSLTEENKKSYNLIVEGMTKKFRKYTAVNDLYLAVSTGECFGLLGANGAGKTTTFRMLTGDEVPSSGDAFVKGFGLINNLKEVRKLIGYCPQFDALFENLTGREHLRLYSLLRGIPSADIDVTSFRIARQLLFDQYLDQKVGEYSGGNKRKLSTALALIGNPPLVYLDEPTAGIDPVAKRHLWTVISELRKQGTTIILTSHSIEECEALCTRLTVMVKGEFKCLGTAQYLKNKFSQGYSLIIKIQKGEDQESDKTNIAGIKKYIKENFPDAIQAEEHKELLVFHIPKSNVSWSKLFAIMESIKNEFSIEDYSVGQTTLEQIILMLTGVTEAD